MVGMAPDDESTFAKGRRVDRYEIRAPIGKGGMGAVYRALDTKLGRTVALKTVAGRRGATLSEEMRGRFTREALAASKVSHRNVVQVLDYGFADDGSPYIVMEYLRGRDLGARLRDSATPLAVDEVADVMLGVCAALTACHQAGIVHRDLKPANIFLADTDTGSEVKVLDFGVSKAPLAGNLTKEGQILGTPQYLSPEQIEGKTVPESDQYALGMVLYVCLTKHRPYEEHDNLSLLRAIELGRFQPPREHRPDLPPALEEIILRALRVSPGERFESVHALGRALLPFASLRGRAQWRDYYMQAPAARPRESSHGLPLGVVLPPHAPRVSLVPDKALPRTASVSGDRPASGGGTPSAAPQRQISTKLEQPPPAGNDGSLLDVAGESTAGEPRVPRSGARRVVIGLAAGGALVGAALYLFSARGRQDRPLASSVVAPPDRTPPPAFAPASRAATVITPAAPAPATTSLSTRIPVPPSPAEPSPPPAPAGKAASARSHRHARHDKAKASAEATPDGVSTPDGVPIMP
jgi:serine/threonine-protein kinase